MRKPVHVFAPRPDCDDSDVDVIFEAPHTSWHNPVENTVPLSKVRLTSHEGYDLGALNLIRSLRRDFPFATCIVSKTTRLYIEHNRTEAHTCPRDASDKERQYRLTHYYQPYIDAVFGAINQSVDNGKLPLLFNIHTYEPELFGYKRKIFAVSGDHEAVLVAAFVKHLRAQLTSPDIQRRLSEAGQQSENHFSDQVDVNVPYNLGRTELGTDRDNPRRKENNAANYTAKYGFPWAHLEVRNDVARLPFIQNIVNRAIQATIDDLDVRDDLEKRQSAHFEGGEDSAVRQVYPLRAEELPVHSSQY